MHPLVSVVIAALVSLLVGYLVAYVEPTLLRLILGSVLLFGTYLAVLLFGMRQKSPYMKLLRETGLWPIGRRRTQQVEA